MAVLPLKIVGSLPKAIHFGKIMGQNFPFIRYLSLHCSASLSCLLDDELDLPDLSFLSIWGFKNNGTLLPKSMSKFQKMPTHKPLLVSIRESSQTWRNLDIFDVYWWYSWINLRHKFELFSGNRCPNSFSSVLYGAKSWISVTTNNWNGIH